MAIQQISSGEEQVADIEIEKIVGRVKSYASLKTDKELATFLGVGSSDFNNRKKGGLCFL